MLLSIQFVIGISSGPITSTTRQQARPDNKYGPITNYRRGNRYQARPYNETRVYQNVFANESLGGDGRCVSVRGEPVEPDADWNQRF